MADEKLTLAQIHALTCAALEGAGASTKNASAVANSTLRAERDGIRSHGLMYVPIYAEHVVCGKVDGMATPIVEHPRPGAITVDAGSGFAHPAIDAGWEKLTMAARENGVAAMTIYNSYNCGVLGHHAERLAEEGFVGLCFTHAPASISPIGGNKPVIGTNPFAIAVGDGKGGATLVIDQSASAIAKSEIMLRAREGNPLEEGWAVDQNGQPTIDANEALKGSMMPSGGYKGFGVGLMVEILASCLSGALLSKDASPFSGTAGGPPRTGQCFVAFDPGGFSNGFDERIAELAAAISDQEGARLPGSNRLENRSAIEQNGVVVNKDLLSRIRKYAQ